MTNILKGAGTKEEELWLSQEFLSLKDFQQWMIQINPPSEEKEILGSDHMAMISKPKKQPPSSPPPMKQLPR
jgi:hypothetical protein